MGNFIFDLQRFAESTIPADGTYNRDGVTYTAINESQLNLDDNGKVTGIVSGSVQAVVTGADDSPIVNFDATDGAINFTATGNGSVLTVTQLFPIEFISGEFTYSGKTIAISAGSDLAIVSQQGNFSLRNENHFEYDSTYTFTDTSMTSDSEHVISVFRLTNGTDVRELHLEQLGKVINNFNERGFTLVEGSSEVLHIGDYDLTATAVDGDAGLNFELGEKGMTFVPNKNDGKLNVSLSRYDTEIISGVLECTSGSITFGYDHAVTFEKGTSFNFTWNNYVTTVTATGDATTAIELTDSGINFTPGRGDGGLSLVIRRGNTPVFAGELNITAGTISFNADEQKFSFTKGTKISLGIGTDGSQEIDFEIVDDDASFTIETDFEGSFTITPDYRDGSVDVTLKRNGKTVFKNKVSVEGSLIVNPEKDLLTLMDGTIISFAFDNYTLTATADGDASSTISLTANGIYITPNTEDEGKLRLTLESKTGSISADIEILKGGLLFGTSGALTVTKDTELEIKFSDDYIINFKATNDAGGSLTLGSDGITFKPSSDEEDGGLKLTVTRNGDTRSASLDVTGSVTYKLDGSITLTKGTVVKNVFDDGNILTITANTDASGSILFNPQTGLTIKPATPDALTATLTTGDLEVVNITSIKGTINYSGGLITASDGTKAHISYYFGWESELRTTGGSASVQFTADRTIYIANEGSTFAVDYLDGTTTEIQKGSYADVYGENIEDYVELVSEGTTLNTNDDEIVFTLDKAGDYTLNGMDVTTTEDNVEVQLTDYDSIGLGDISFSSTDENFVLELGNNTASFKGSTADVTFAGMNRALTFDTTDGEFSFDNSTKKISIAAGTTTSHFTAANDISATYKVEEDIYYFELDDEANLTSDSYNLSATLGGVVSYNPSTGTYGLTGANSSHGNGKNSYLEITSDSGYSLKLATNDTTVTFIPTFSDGKFEVNFPNERKHEMLFTLSKDGQTTFEGQVIIDGTITFDADAKELTLTKDTVLTFIGENNNNLEIKALNDAGGQLSFTDDGIRFAPNSGDGQLQLNFVATNRKANIDVSSGAIIFGSGGNLSLEKDTVVNITWEDGTELTLSANDTGGSIGFDAQGLKVSSDGELSVDLSTASGVKTSLTDLSGTIHYNAGKVLFDANSKITATSTLGGQPIDLILESQGSGGYAEISANGTTYAAGSAPLKITWARDDKESTFSINSGSVFIGHGIFEIAQGSDLSTDLKDLVPALYFSTTDPGSYTINGQTITTTAENISMTATDDYMTFKTSDDVVICDDMTFAGNGNVSLSSGGVVLGAGVVADGFGKDKMFILAQAGNVTADARIFELTEDVPTGISVTGATDGFIFSRTNTEESEARFDDPDPENVGKIFTEEFFLTNDDSYRIQTDLLGLQKIIGVSAPSSLNAAATFDGEPERTVFDVVTETEGVFTVGEKTYSISGDDSVAIKTIFNETLEGVRGFDDLNGTVSGDFTEHEVSINGSASAVQPVDDTNISISADDSGFEISGLDNNSLLKVSATDSYVVNNTTINANGGDYIMGLDNGAALYGMNNDTLITGTEGNDTIENIGTNVTINALGGDDSITNSGDNVSIDAGEGKNQIKLSDGSAVVVFNGQTTVEGFKTGFGDGSDTVYIPAGFPAVDYIDGTLTFYDDTNSLTFKEITKSAGITTYYAENGTTAKQVYIADDDWYKVADGEAEYYVGATAKMNHGIDFSGVTRSLNVTLDTVDEPNDDSTWINNVYSIRGGDGLTTITGSEKSDTIIGGTGATTINAAAGDDLISLSGSSALITYSEGDGNDTIIGFDSNATLSPDGTYKTQVSGNDLIVTIGESKITLVDAASLPYPNIESSNPLVKVVEAILKRTPAGYPVIAGLVFNPEEITGPEPTNYAAKEDWTITSADNLELYGVHYTPEKSNDKWVVLVHGYGCMYESMNPFATFYLANNYNVLMIDQRAAGKSEGTWLTMGVAESQDVALWTQEIASRYPDSKITLHGVSMGAATALLTAARQDAVNVTSIVEDCGYSDVLKTFDTIVASHPELAALGISREIVPLTDPVAESLTGYYLHDAAPINSIATVKKPTLFISGDDDGVAPVSMLHELYDASGAEDKEQFIVKGAGHARSGLIKPLEYSNAVFRFLSEANGEGWETTNIAENISLRGTKYNDTIANSGENVTINTGAGDDSIYNIADNVSINAGTGNDTIYNHADNITIDGGKGNDSISNNSDNVVFVWSGGNDTITGFKEDSALSIGSDYSTQVSGDDVIVSVGKNTILLKGASDLDNVEIIGGKGVTIENDNSDSLISGTNGNDSITNYGSNVTIQAKAGMDTIFNEGESSIIDGGNSADSIYNYSPQGVLLSDNVSINGGAGNDTIRNEHAYNVTISGGSGHDKIIVVTGDHTTIDGGAGNDTILGESLEGGDSHWAMGGYANINGGSGDDYIDPGFSDSASILGGDGNDTIINEGNDTTINGGAGNDIISLHGASLANNVIKYEVGDGNDSIFGFNETSKLSITSGTEYSTVESGDDVIVKVGSNEITIAGGANLSTINITNQEIPALNVNNTANNTLISGTELADTIKNSGDNVTIKGMAGDDSITNSGTNASINGSAGEDTIKNSGANSTVLGEYGNDKLSNSADDVLLDGGYGNDTIENSGDNVTIRPGKGYNYTSNTGDNVLFNFAGGIDTIVGFSENSTLTVGSDDYETMYAVKDVLVRSGDDVAILKDAFLTDDSININGTTYELSKVIELPPVEDNDFTISRSNVSVVGNKYDDKITVSGSNVTITGGDGSDQISLGADAENNLIEYAEGDGNDSIFGFNETTEISISGEHSSVKVGDNVIFKVGNDSITVVDGSSVIATDFEDGESILLTKKGERFVDGEKVFELTENVPSGVTITGEKNGFTSSITESDGKIFVEEFIAKYDDSYTVQIGGDGLHTISGINAGTEVSTSATKDSESVENQFYLVMGDAGSYTLGDLEITATNDGTEILFASDGINFAADAGISYDGKTFSGDGNIELPANSYQLPAILGASVSATGFEDESFILREKGTTTVDGRTFELTENISDGMMIESADNGYTFSHEITQKEVTKNNLPSDYLGKICSENVIVEGDETYSLRADSFGLKKVSGISDGATINGGDTSVDGDSDDKYAQGGQYFYVDTDTEGDFTIGEKTYNISGDSNVEIEAEFEPEKSYASGFASLDGTVSGDFTGDEFYVNGSKKPILVEGDDSIKVVGSSSGTKLLDVSDGASLASLGGVKEVQTDTEGEFWIGAEPVPFGVTVTGDDNITFGFDYKGELTSVDNLEGDIEFSKGTGGALSINGIGIKTKGTKFSTIGAYDNSLYIHDVKGGTITAYEPDKVWLQMLGETMTLNGNRLTLTNDADGIWIRDKEIVGLDDGASLKVSTGGNYLANETSLKARSGDVIIGLENDAYIYDAKNPLITRQTSNEEIIKIFNPENTNIVQANEIDEQNITLNGGDLAIVEDTSAQVNITAGDDTIVSQGENVNVTLTPEKNTWLFPLDGKMTLEGYDEATRSGFGTTFADILSAVEDGRIDFNNGMLALGSAQIDVGQNSALMNFFDRVGRLQKVGYASSNDSLDVSGKTEDLLLVAKKNGTIRGGSGDDTILANGGNFVDGGAGANLVSMTGGGNSNIVLHGNTTVKGFHTGFGDGSDTIYIAGDPAGVDFKSGGLTFGNSSDTVTLSDVNTTAKVNIFHERRDVLNKGIFIAPGDWYSVEDSDLTVNEGEEVYFVGTAADPKAGVDFSGITSDLNVTMDTAYIDSADYVPTTMWVNGVYSLKGGAGLTTIIGSDKNDTILAGTGETKINGGAGHDKMFGNTEANKNVATFNYMAGDGRDSIENFDFADNAQDVTADKVQLDDNSAISEVFLRGDDVMIKVDGADGFLMLENAKGKSFRVNDDLIAKVDTNVEYDGFTNCYVGIGTKATLTVGKNAGNVEVWLSDDSLEYHGTMYDGNFKVLDASQADGNNILAGNELSNVITGGSGENSLWGGYSSENDTLIGGAGQNTFFYLQGNGRDVIQNAHDGDSVILDDITLDQIADANITAGGVVLNFNDGGSITVNSTADVTYQLADGSKYSANRSTYDWDSK